jgi:hypothetical protein
MKDIVEAQSLIFDENYGITGNVSQLKAPGPQCHMHFAISY